MSTVLGRVLFTTREVCRAAALNVETLRFWVRRGAVAPVVRSTRGGATGHEYTAGQLYALGMLAIMLRCAHAAGCKLGLVPVRRVMALAAQLTDDLWRLRLG